MEIVQGSGIRWLVLASLSWGGGVAAGFAGEVLKLQAGVVVVVGASEALAVRKAAGDLCRDLQMVLGEASPMVEESPKDGRAAIVVSSSGEGVGLSGSEAHAIVREGNVVRLAGADMRGAVYAIYSFSERFLDIPPWWFWAEWKPRRASRIEIPEGTNMRWQSPQVRWRGWFPNDTDLLSPWILKDYEAHWDRVLETMLRLKLNLLDVGEFAEDSLRKLRLPRDRGLAVTTTHLAPFGASLRDWAEYWEKQGHPTPPQLRLGDMKSLERFWEDHIQLAIKEKVEMIWTIGFRGDGDKGFYKTFADAPSDDASRAKVIERVLHQQVALLKRLTGKAKPVMRTVIYDEVSDYLAAGLFQPPEEPSLIWNFSAARHDHFPGSDLRSYRAPAQRPLGYYFNVQFTNTGSHLADGEGPWKMEQNHRMVVESGPNLQLSIVNSGNTREFPVTLAAHAKMMWDFEAFSAYRFVEGFCEVYWGPKMGGRVAELYRDFFNAYWEQRRPDIPNFPRQYFFHDLRVARAARDLMKGAADAVIEPELLGDRGIGYYRIVPGDSGAASKVEAVRIGHWRAAEAFARIARRCEALESELEERGAAFLKKSLSMQAEFMAAASGCTAACAEAFMAKDDEVLYRDWMLKALDEAETMRKTLRSVDGDGPLKGWYEPEKIFGLQETRAMIERRVSGQVKIKVR